MTPVQATLVLLALVRPPAEPPRSGDLPDFQSALGLSRYPGTSTAPADSAPLTWMTTAAPLPDGTYRPSLAWRPDEFQRLLDRLSLVEDRDSAGPGLGGIVVDTGRWKYQRERSGGVYQRNTSFDLPDPQELETAPYARRNWTAQEKVQIPVPIPLPVAEQMFVYGQLDGSGDALDNQPTNLSGKTGVAVKWSVLPRSEVQVRYATLFSYADDVSAGRFQERAQPTVEVMARMPLMGPLEIEYTGSAIPAVTRTDTDQLNQQLRLALPLRGNNELEFGARYRWEYAPEPTPWVDRAQLFLGIKLKR